jgi:cation:H+ antiporter
VVRWRALSPLLLVLVLGTVAVLALGADGTLSRIDGLVLLAAYVGALAFAFARGGNEAAEVRDEIAQYARTSDLLGQNIIRFALGGALLWLGSLLVVGGEGMNLFGLDLSGSGAARIGEGLGLSPVLTGLLPVAIGTALPETAAAIAAARRGQGDMVMGHVIGASVFNVLVIVGGMAAWSGLALPMTMMGPGHFVLPMGYELLAALAFALMLYPALRGDLRVSRGEGGVLLVAFVLWIGFELLLAGK